MIDLLALLFVPQATKHRELMILPHNFSLLVNLRKKRHLQIIITYDFPCNKSTKTENRGQTKN